ncbi:hypothetical protein BJX63DRAFT_398170 [Aspergillus granulosus]|uniref:Uncharacterized protein n=1 Tax=Aspergillus granulosus TaxID=176169 RepID=A0ABR4H8G5_9EURO
MAPVSRLGKNTILPRPPSELPSESPSTGDNDRLEKANLPLRSKQRTDEREFMFVDVQADTGRGKKAFVLKRFHQRKKQASIDRLRSSQLSSRMLATGFPSSSSGISGDSKQGQSQEEGMEITTNRYMGIQRRCDMSPFIRYMKQGYVDPFDTVAVPMTYSMNMYFYHYRVHTIPGAYPINAVEMSNWWGQMSIASPALFHSLLSHSAGQKALLESKQGMSLRLVQKSFEDSLRFRTRSIRSLNSLLQDPVTAAAESTIVLVGVIVMLEALDANFEAVRAHKQGLDKLISLAGGLEGLSHHTLATMYQADLIIAALHNSQPSLPMLLKFRHGIQRESRLFSVDTPVGAFEPSNSQIPQPLALKLAAVGSQFAPTTAWYNELHPSIKRIVEAFRWFVRHLETAQVLPNLVMPNDNHLLMVINYELTSRCYPATSNDLNEPLRHALRIYTFLRIIHFQGFNIMRCMAHALMQSLVEVSRLSYLQTTAPDLLLWILFIGGMASRGDNSHRWFVLQIADTAHRLLGLEKWDEVRLLLGVFFYTDQPKDTAAEDLWDEVLMIATGSVILPL